MFPLMIWKRQFLQSLKLEVAHILTPYSQTDIFETYINCVTAKHFILNWVFNVGSLYFYWHLNTKVAAGIAQSVQRFATGWMVLGSNPGGVEIFRTRPDRSWDPPSLLYNGYPVFPGDKAAGAWCWPPTPIFSAKVLNRVELHLYLPSGP